MKRAWIAFVLFGMLLALPVRALAATPTYYSNRATFEAELLTIIVDDYSNPAYVFIQSNAAMSAVLGETDYETTGFNDLNIVQGNDTYCAGCNGSFRLWFQTTSVGTPVGVFGVGLDVSGNSSYYAYITFGDGTTANIALPAAGSFWAVTAPELIQNIHFGLSGGGTTTSLSFWMDNLTIGDGASCGNGAVDPGEDCDDGNTTSGDGCSSVCQFEICGNNILDPGEICDDGNVVNGDGCSANCQSDETCGNGYVDNAAGEQCDDGGNSNGDGCSSVCLFEICGNGILDPGEVCDDGNLNDGDGCNATCSSNETCGNGILDTAAGEACDDGNNVDGDGCQANCSLPGCGDGVLDPGEECDDGNSVNGDGCNSTCTSNETCGNNILDTAAGEQCDDGGVIAGDGCGPTCQLEICGNGVQDPAEVCDDGNTADADGCNATCTSNETCGNGVIDGPVGEQCDDGNTTPGDDCGATCLLEYCGNGVIDGTETCDDGNTVDGDGCSASCQSDGSCGNGVLDPGEQCDDGVDNSNVNADACRTTCAPASCGDGVIDSGEQCDDGAANSASGPCTQSCTQGSSNSGDSTVVDDGGCGCRVGSASGRTAWALVSLFGGLLLLGRRRRRSAR